MKTIFPLFAKPVVTLAPKIWKALALALASLGFSACVYVDPVAGYSSSSSYHQPAVHKTTRVAYTNSTPVRVIERRSYAVPRPSFVQSRLIYSNVGYRPSYRNYAYRNHGYQAHCPKSNYRHYNHYRTYRNQHNHRCESNRAPVCKDQFRPKNTRIERYNGRYLYR